MSATARKRAAVGKRGFTLLETMVAVAILGLGITSILQLMGASARNASRAQATTRALFVAERLMEEMLSLGKAELLARSGESGDQADLLRSASGPGRLRPAERRSAPGSTRYLYALRVVAERADPGLYRVDVEVAWKDPSPGRVELATLRRFAPPDFDSERLP